MDLHTVLDSTVGKIIGSLLASAGATMLAWLKRKGWPWATPILYGLGAFSLIISGLIGLQWWLRPIEKPPERITSANVEAHIRDWLDAFGLGVQRQEGSASDLVFAVTLHNNNHVMVSRNRQRDRYITLQGKINVSAEHAAIIAKVPAGQAMRLYDEITLEMARSKVGFAVVTTPPGARVQAVVVTKGLLIDDLTGDILAKGLDEIDSGMVLAKHTIRLALANTHAVGTTLLQ
ncbi:MAG: DUF2299 family protein [Planctomycetota bacterium]